MSLNEIIKIKFGSHLYGTSTPDSDIDYKGIFLPSKKDILLNRVPKSVNLSTNKSNIKNSSDDVDYEIYSIHYFFKLACEGQTVALDMLYAPENMTDGFSNIWLGILEHRSKLHTRNLNAFVGYARRQAAKYGIKGSRLNAADELIYLLAKHNPEVKLQYVWKALPINDHSRMVEDSPNGLKQYQICGKILQESQSIGYTLDIMRKFYSQYGARAKEAADNKNIDWKAISHAIRAAFQTKEILTEGKITFPLKNASYLLEVKSGNLDYISVVAPYLEDLMSEVEELSAKSTLPEKVDKDFWDNLLVEIIEEYVL